jgi:beta-glucosidase
MYHEESLHGNQALNATNFPTPLALASSWNPSLMTEIFSAIAKEVRSRGAHQVLAPVVDLLQDPRWGRSEETLGEDPYLIAELAKAEVKAYQGDSYILGPDKVAATLKHFGVHGRSEGGTNVAPSLVDELTMRQYFFPSFKSCVQDAKVMSVMPCYNEVTGVPAHSNVRILKEILRDEWGFRGVIVSDYYAITEMERVHHVTAKADTLSTALLAFNAGVDVETPDRAMYVKIPELVKQGKIIQKDLDTTVARILRTKFRLGLFDRPYADAALAEKTIGSNEHRAIALKAAQQGITLLKNDNDVLPLIPGKYKTVAIIGPNGDKCILGGYSNKPKQKVTPLEAIKAKLAGKCNVVFAEGCRITDSGDWFSDTVNLTPDAVNLKLIAEAVEVAKKADYVVLCLGGNEATSREAWGKPHSGDLTTLDLLSLQNQLIDEIAKLNKPTAAFVFNGPPTSFLHLDSKVSALVNCFYLGQETGQAVADVLVGDVNPSGKLPVSIARSVGHLPAYYNHKAAARRNYHFETPAPLYPFGHGLSYTKFQMGAPQLSKTTISKADNIKVSVEVTNIGNKEGTEVVQCYVHDLVSSVTRPVQELKGFQRITLKPGEKKIVELVLTPEHFGMYNAKMNWVVEPGQFEIMTGNSSATVQKVMLNITN